MAVKADHIQWPSTSTALATSKSFERKYGFPGTVGVIDGCHVSLFQAPHESHNSYFCRKGFYSLVFQAVCNERLIFIDICAAWPGSVHDARVFRTSSLGQAVQNMTLSLPSSDHIIGDLAYPLSPLLMVSHKDNGHLTQSEQLFNVKLSQCRSTIERAFSRLKGKFWRLQDLNMTTMTLATHVIIACCVLHNIILEEEEVEEDEGDCDVLDDPHSDNNPDYDKMPSQQLYLQGKQKRQKIMEKLVLSLKHDVGGESK